MRPGRPERNSLDRPITTAGQLLVEGRVPEMFFREMVEAWGISGAVEVRTFGDISKPNLQTYLELLVQKAVFKATVKRLGIIRDAERASAAAAFQSVQASLRGAGLPEPGQLGAFAGDPVAVGVFVLPNCRDSGMLEDLCMTAITEAERNLAAPLLPCVDEFFVCLNGRNRQAANPAKARFAGYALACDVIDPQLGRAAQKGVIPWEANAFTLLKTFLQNVAGQQ